MRNTLRLDLEDAKILAEGAEKSANNMGIKVCISICDENGDLILFHKMNDAFLISTEISISKAYTAVAVKMPTRTIGETTYPGKVNYGLQFTNLGRFTILPGGFPIIINGNVIGGIGISGGTSEQDEKIGLDSIAYFKSKTNLQVKTNF
ncbi:GlcG/HbpS family heme-binding protein [Acidianus brierleyi]|uniref:Uncharacterized protein n=1 Tax=Acidianus brierleyi TaxID=41673 RepID=A0A2U9IHT0_9CREN|nr:heme-binding protein [Acidianus brierleyi]AWR95597.1 heme-binding protein [Acidianus brierleyi]